MIKRTVLLLSTFLLATLILASVHLAQAQPKGQVYRIGWLSEGETPKTVTKLLEALREFGYIDGHNLLLERKYAGTREQLPDLAAKLVKSQLDLIVTFGTPATRAAKKATATIPIVFGVGADPVKRGLVASFSQPGGNLTGFVSTLLGPKLLEILKEAVPNIRSVACPCRRNPNDKKPGPLTKASRRLGLELLAIAMDGPNDFDRFFAAAHSGGADAVLVHNVAWFTSHLPRLGKLATKSHLPAIGYRRPFAQAGGLLSYGRIEGQNLHRIADKVDKILKGSKPADLPVERSSRFQLVINLKTAKQLGLTIPPDVLYRADEIIK